MSPSSSRSFQQNYTDGSACKLKFRPFAVFIFWPPPWIKTGCRSDGQYIPHLSRNRQIHVCLHKIQSLLLNKLLVFYGIRQFIDNIQSLVPTICQSKSVHTLTSFSITIHFNIISQLHGHTLTSFSIKIHFNIISLLHVHTHSFPLRNILILSPN